MFYGRDAEETKEWDRFWCSGKVEDYLRYRNCCGEEREPEGTGSIRERTDSVHAGFFTGDGNCTEIYSRG